MNSQPILSTGSGWYPIDSRLSIWREENGQKIKIGGEVTGYKSHYVSSMRGENAPYNFLSENKVVRIEVNNSTNALVIGDGETELTNGNCTIRESKTMSIVNFEFRIVFPNEQQKK